MPWRIEKRVSASQILNLPEEAPVMVLPNAVLVPNALLPLHIFEQQYRDMLIWSLERNRLFCIALRRPGETDANPDNFAPIGGIGLVRACVGAEDGTSNLILQGLARVRFGAVIPTPHLFRMAEITEMKSKCKNLAEAEALGAKVVELCCSLQEQCREMPTALVEKLRQVTDPALLSDIVTQTFVRDPAHQQALLEEPLVNERMRLLIRYLQPGVVS